jgi:hypothetical protein
MNIQQPTRPHAEREYLHTFTAGALLPMAQATLMGFVVFLVAWMIARIVFDAVDPHKWAVIPGAGVWVWNLFKLFHHWLNLTTIETVLQKDINGDGVIGPVSQPAAQNEPRKIRIQVEQVTEGRYQSNTIDFPCDDEQLYTLAMGLNNNIPFSERAWTGAGKPFSTNEFRELKNVMKTHELIEYVSEADPRQGMRLTAKGKALMEKIALPSPAPETDAPDSTA